MAEDVGAVRDMTEAMREKAFPAAVNELKALTTFAESSSSSSSSSSSLSSSSSMKNWDIAYWSERQRESLFDYREEELRPYFALHNVLDGLFTLTRKLFNVDVVDATPGTDLWHPDVRFFHIWRSPEEGEDVDAVRADPEANIIASFFVRGREGKRARRERGERDEGRETKLLCCSARV